MQYCYHARSQDGLAVQGRISAPSLQAVIEHLRSRTLTAVDIRERNGIDRITTPLRQASLASSMTIALRTLGTLLGVGLPIRRAIAIVMQSTRNSTLREGFAALTAAVETGESLAEAMHGRDDLFSAMTVALVRAGERGGTLPETLERHAQNLEQQQALQRRLLTTMIYPLIVLTTALGLIVFLLITVLPMFASLFEQLHVEQPLLLRVLLAIPPLFNLQNIAIAIAVCTVLLFAVRLGFSRAATHTPIATARYIRLPIVSDLQDKVATARFSRALATLLKAGVGLPEALQCTRPILHSKRFALAIDAVGEALRDGNSLATAMEERRIFDAIFLHLVRVGEETGTLDEQLFRVADWFERDFAEASTRAAALIEPMLIIGIGSLVGTIVFSVFVPLYSLIGGIR